MGVGRTGVCPLGPLPRSPEGCCGVGSPSHLLHFIPDSVSQIRQGLPILRTRTGVPVSLSGRLPDASPLRKKLSTSCTPSEWKGASSYVAKRYIESVDRDVLRGRASTDGGQALGRGYNRHKPPSRCVAPLPSTFPHQRSPDLELRAMEVLVSGPPSFLS